MASQSSKLLINAGANLIRYPDLVLVLAGYGVGGKQKKRPNKYSFEHIFQGIH